MELATRTFDLARAFADISLNGNSIANATTELARWMARECILESEFGYFQNLARGVTFPNDSGLRIRHMLLEAIPKFKKIGGLHLLNSGSIGRMLAFDPEYCYMVSTVSVLLAYHDIPFAASVLCNMALDHGVDRQEKANVNSYDIRRTRLRPVMDKVVQSIALNVVNSGHDLRGLPFDFENNCIHCLQDTTLSAAIMAIERTEGDVLVRCDHFLADLFVWLLNHWQGILTFTVCSKILYEQSQGQQSRKLRFMVQKFCYKKGSNHQYGSENLHIVAITEGSRQNVLLDKEFLSKATEPAVRSDLYAAVSINKGPRFNHMGWDQGLLDTSKIADVRMTTQMIVRWLLALPLRPFEHKPMEMELRPIFDSPEPTDVNFGFLFRRWPKIINMKFGSPNQALVVFKGVPDLVTTDGERSTSVQAWVECFPPLDALFRNISADCRCDDCLNGYPIGWGKAGCVRQTALTAFTILFAHSIADAFGAKDASGLIDATDLSLKVVELLEELVLNQRISWNAWFQVACAVALGCPWPILHTCNKLRQVGEVEDGASLIAAAQYGSLLAVATWTDLTRQQRQAGCFGMEVAEGHLSGIGDDFAIIHTEQTAELSDSALKDFSIPNLLDQNSFDRLAATDSSNPQVEIAIMRLSKTTFRLLTMVLDTPYLRMVDPAQVLWGLLRGTNFRCPNEEHRHIAIEVIDQRTTVWTFTELLGGWDEEPRRYVPSENEDGHPEVEVATCNTYLKLNIAMALSPRGFLTIDSGSTCLTAAKKIVEGDEWMKSTRIINLRIDEGALNLRQ